MSKVNYVASLEAATIPDVKSVSLFAIIEDDEKFIVAKDSDGNIVPFFAGGGGLTSASNGLTVSGAAVILGGSLNMATTIAADIDPVGGDKFELIVSTNTIFNGGDFTVNTPLGKNINLTANQGPLDEINIVSAGKMLINVEKEGLIIGAKKDIYLETNTSTGENGNIILDCTGTGDNGAVIFTPVSQASIVIPLEGGLIYNSATKKFNFWNGAAWEVITSV